MVPAVLALATLFAVFPVHGTVLAVKGDTAIVRNDAVTGIMPPLVGTYRVAPHLPLARGEGLDGFIDRSTKPWRWYDAAIAGKFTPGLPDPGRVVPIDLGSQIPHMQLVDQTGRLVDPVRDFAGRVLLLSFIFTRCPDKDECPLISGKYTYLENHLDPKHFHLIEISLDPVYDSPAVLAAYAKQYSARVDSWSILTGQQHVIKHLLDRFGISSLRTSTSTFIHSDKLLLIDQKGQVADVVNTAAWDPNAVIAQAQHTAGMLSNPFGRIELALVASTVALCGGSQFAGIVLLETVLFLVIAGISALLLTWVARALWRNA